MPAQLSHAEPEGSSGWSFKSNVIGIFSSGRAKMHDPKSVLNTGCYRSSGPQTWQVRAANLDDVKFVARYLIQGEIGCVAKSSFRVVGAMTLRAVVKIVLVLAILPMISVAPPISGERAAWFVPAANAAKEGGADTVLPVLVDTIQYKESYTAKESYAGKISGARSSQLGFERGGLLAEIVVEEGLEVEQGAVLARLDQRALQAERLEIEARLRSAEAQIVQLEAELELAKRTEKRREQLVKNNNTSRQSYDEAAFRTQSLAAQLDAAKANLAQAQAQLEANSVRIDLSELKAPFGGAITVKYVDEGTVVQPGQAVLEIVENGRLEMRVGLPESAAGDLVVGETYTATTRRSDLVVRLLRIVDQIADSTRTVTAIFGVAEKPAWLKDGTIARLVLERETPGRGFWLPLTALTEGRRGLWNAYAVVPQEDGSHILELRPIDILYAEIDRAYVRGTFEEGELVMKTGIHRVIPGLRVRPVTESGDAPTVSLLR